MSEEKVRVLVQVKDPQGIQQQSAAGKVFELTNDHLAKIAQTVDAFSSGMLDRLSAVGKPSSVKLEFGINAGGSAGIPFITEGKVEAHVTVEVAWQLKPEET